jgi:hypothetical protein
MGTDVQQPEEDGWTPHANDTFIGGMGEVLERRRAAPSSSNPSRARNR